MKGYIINGVCYVFPQEVGQIPAVEADVIYVQAENINAWKDANADVANKIVKYNYNVMTVNPKEWADHLDDDLEPPVHDYSHDYLTFTALEDTTFTFSTNALQYSTDDGANWITLEADTATPTVTAGNKILWKQTVLIPDEVIGIGTFSATGNFKASGNIMSLYYGDDFIGQNDLTGKNYAFLYLFKSNEHLINAENLILPATTLADYCYAGMFIACRSLTTAPELPATTLADYCYAGMFSVCSSLNYIKCLATDISAVQCTNNWVNGVDLSGTFVKDVSMNLWTTGDDGIPDGWTVEDAAA